jgi:hypothetical protein
LAKVLAKKRSNNSSYLLLYAAIASSFIAYYLPWITSKGVLNIGARDLAEWASLYPATGFNSSPLTTALLLRIPGACLAIILSVSAPARHYQSWRWQTAVFLTGLLIISILPPLEFFGTQSHNPNYQQQFILTIVALVGSLLGIFWGFGNYKWVALSILSVIGIIVSSIGLIQGVDLLRRLDLEIHAGIGLAGTLISYGVIALLSVTAQLKQGNYL